MVEQETLHLLVGHGGGDGVPAEHLADLFFRGVVQLGKAGDLGVHLLLGHGDLFGFGNGAHRQHGLICKRPAGNTYKIQDDAWALDFYYAHKDDTAAQLVHAVLTNTQMWDQDLTKIEGLEAAVLADLEMIRTQGAEAAYKSCL